MFHSLNIFFLFCLFSLLPTETSDKDDLNIFYLMNNLTTGTIICEWVDAWILIIILIYILNYMYVCVG